MSRILWLVILVAFTAACAPECDCEPWCADVIRQAVADGRIVLPSEAAAATAAEATPEVSTEPVRFQKLRCEADRWGYVKVIGEFVNDSEVDYSHPYMPQASLPGMFGTAAYGLDGGLLATNSMLNISAIAPRSTVPFELHIGGANELDPVEIKECRVWAKYEAARAEATIPFSH